MQPDTRPTLSVIIPVHNGGASLARCLDALRAPRPAAREVIVVDDCSTDRSADVARSRGFEVVSLDARRGPAAARNVGARRARGKLLLFLDADVVARHDTLARVEAFFGEREEVAAVFGSYDDAPGARNFVSQYKNLVHHFIHQRSRADARAPAALGCGARAALGCGGWALVAPSPFAPAPLFGGAGLSLAGVLLLNLRLLRFLRARRGLPFALASFWMLALYYLYSACAFAFCCCGRALRAERPAPPAGRRAGAPGRV